MGKFLKKRPRGQAKRFYHSLSAIRSLKPGGPPQYTGNSLPPAASLK
jgi:hypothetical protein